MKTSILKYIRDLFSRVIAPRSVSRIIASIESTVTELEAAAIHHDGVIDEAKKALAWAEKEADHARTVALKFRDLITHKPPAPTTPTPTPTLPAA